MYAELSTGGDVGTVYSVEYFRDASQPISWRCLAFLQMPANGRLWGDKSVAPPLTPRSTNPFPKPIL